MSKTSEVLFAIRIKIDCWLISELRFFCCSSGSKSDIRIDRWFVYAIGSCTKFGFELKCTVQFITSINYKLCIAFDTWLNLNNCITLSCSPIWNIELNGIEQKCAKSNICIMNAWNWRYQVTCVIYFSGTFAFTALKCTSAQVFYVFKSIDYSTRRSTLHRESLETETDKVHSSHDWLRDERGFSIAKINGF